MRSRHPFQHIQHCRSTITKTTEGLCGHVGERDREQQRENIGVSANSTMQLPLLEWEIIHLGKGLFRGGKGTQSWLSYRLGQYENQWAVGKRPQCEYFFSRRLERKCCCSILWICQTFITDFSQQWDSETFMTFLITAAMGLENICFLFENRCDYRASAFLVDQEAPSSQCVDHTTVRFFHLHPSFIVLYPFRPNFWLNAGAIPRKRSKAKISFLGPRASVKACSKHLLLATLITEDRHLEYPVGQRCTKRWKNHAPSDLAICYTAIDFCSIWLNACLHFNDLHHTVHLCLDLSHPHKHKQDGTYAYLITHTHTQEIPTVLKRQDFWCFVNAVLWVSCLSCSFAKGNAEPRFPVLIAWHVVRIMSGIVVIAHFFLLLLFLFNTFYWLLIVLCKY